MPYHITENNLIRRRVITKFWPLASLVLIVFVLVSFVLSKDYITGSLHLVNLLIISILIPFFLRTKKVLAACNTLCAIGMLTIITFLFTGGPTGEGFWWSGVYVIGAFLVTTKNWAIFWLSLYLVLSAVIVGLAGMGLVVIAYTLPQLLHLLFMYLITFGFVFYFNNVREYYLHLANRRADELRQLNRELTFTNKELEEFVYVASHDLQEPLQTIINFSGLIEESYSGKLGEEGEQYLGFILGASSKMKLLISDLLGLSRVGRNKAFVSIDCSRLLKEVLAHLETTIRESGATIRFSGLPAVPGTEIELRQLFQNLISNAIKFRRKNVFPEIEIAAEERAEDYLFSIRDNGIGIEAQFTSRIFVIFQRLHSDAEYPGTGIGLATCKKVVMAHKGKIWVKSEPGEGSTFYFTLAKNIRAIHP